MKTLQFLGVATVANTKQTNSKEIMVNFAGFTPTADGRSLAQVSQQEETSVNAKGETVKSQSLTSNTHPASWRAIGEPNRMTAPDVREGSQVAIYQVQGQGKLYWTSFGVGAETHRLETIVMGYSANPNIGDNIPFDPKDYYTFTISTHEGHVTWRTSQANGEKSAFEVKLDAKEGCAVVRGSNNSILEFHDDKSSFTYQNREGTLLAVDKKKMMLYTEDSIAVVSKESVSIRTKDFALQCETIKVKANTADIDIGTTNWDGDFHHDGMHTQKGDSLRQGNTMSTGVVQGLGGVRTSLEDVDTHVHPGVETGKGSTLTPLPVKQAPILGG